MKDAYPLPRIDVCLDALAGACWFSAFDLRSRYHQVKMELRDADKTTFATRRGTFRFKVMPFGLCNAPATFQQLMNVALAGLDPEVCLMYLDDIIVHSVDLESHLVLFEILLMRLMAADLKLKVSKCQLFQRKVAFPGASGKCRWYLYRSNEGDCGWRLAGAMLPAECAFLLGGVFLLP